MALRADGTVAAWGDDAYGEVGDGVALLSAAPVRVPGLPAIAAVSEGGDHELALTADGHVWTWGANYCGQLGDGSTVQRPSPLMVAGLESVIAVAGGRNHSVAIKSDGTVWAWGCNAEGEVGDGTNVARLRPVRVAILTDVISVSAGETHTLALRRDGTVWAWGGNATGQLGDGTTVDRYTPIQVSGMTGMTQVSAGIGYSAALRGDATVWTWGLNSYGCLGDGTFIDRRRPVQALVSNVSAISAGTYHMLALKSDSTVWGWGSTYYGELASAARVAYSTPIALPSLGTAASISAGSLSTWVLKSDGTIWAIGFNNLGQLGDGTTANRSAPVQVSGLNAVVGFSGGVAWANAMAVRSDGSVWTWGDNAFGELGGGLQPGNRTVPTKVVDLSDVRAIAATTYGTAYALRTDGTVWSWGDNNAYGIGDGTATSRSSPALVTGLSGVTAIAAGFWHALALKNDGTVWGWGQNGDAELGGTDQFPVVAPRPVPGLSQIVAISAGGDFSVAIRGDGSLLALGKNAAGQLGDGTQTARTSPVQVVGISDVMSVSAGGAHVLALRHDGTVWAWGSNETGQLGDGTLVNRLVPIQVRGIARAIAVSAGDFHSLALLADGTVAAWGANSFGELGDGSLQLHLTPVQVPGLTGISAVSAGNLHSLALSTDGVVWAWGANYVGQLGDGTYTTRPRPVVVLATNGAGSIQANDWFFDLDPSIPSTIPPGNVPAFLLTATGSVNTPVVKVDANVRFRPQDVGKKYAIFFYAPSSLVKAAKDGGACALGQLGPSGLQSSSGALSFAGDILTSQGQATSILDNQAIAGVAGSTACVGAGTTTAEALSNAACAATIPGNSVCLPPGSSNSSTSSANSPGALSGLWWNASESGWGIDFTQRRNILFAAWYTYDTSGNPKWYVASNCAMATVATTGTCTGDLYEVNGPTFFGTQFNTSAVQVATAGSLQVTFQNANSASMTYTMGTQARTVAITRQPIASGTTPPATDYTDLWYNPGESGWGIAIAQQFNVMFLAWYVYDAAGKPVWYVASNCAVNATGNGCSGTLYRTTGPALGPTFDSSRVQILEAGTVTTSFGDANNGTLSYTVGGVTSSKAITRQLF